MNKNTVIAFVLVLITVAFFSSSRYNQFYYEKILKKPYPDKQVEQVQKYVNKEKAEQPVNAQDKSTEEKNGNPVENKTEVIGSTNAQDSISGIVTSADTVWIETDKLIVGISQKGARIISLQMKDYKNSGTGNDESYVDLVPDSSVGGAQLSIASISYDAKMFEYKGGDTKKVNVKDGEKKDIEFEYKGSDGRVVKKVFKFENGTYKIGMHIEKPGMGGERVSVGWNSGIVESEKDLNSRSPQEQLKVHYYDGDAVQHISMKKEGTEETTGFYKWIGITSKYFFLNIVTDSTSDADLTIKGFEAPKIGNEKIGKVNYALTYQKTADKSSDDYWFYAGPTKLQELKQYDLKFEKILFPVLGWPKVFFWSDRWFPPVAEFILWLLYAMFNLVKDYGIAIILITIISRIVTYPMTQSSTKSMTRMKDVQPKVNHIRQKYKNNPKKMNEEMMALYKQEGINPLNPGCLPMFLQMPVFIALFVVLRKAIELRGAHTILIPWIKDLSKPEVLISLKGIIPNGIPLYGSNIALLPIVMAVLTFFQNKMTIKDPNQKAMIYFMPVFMLVLFNNFPSGLVLYWTASNAIAVLQQYITNRKQPGVIEVNAVKKR